MKIKNFLSEHKKLFIIVSIFLIVISLIGGSYAMFQRLDKAEYANNYKTGLLQIVFDDTSEGLGGVINVEGAVPTSNSDGANLTPYKFKIINKGNLDYKFDLKLVIDADYMSTHGCSDNQLSADYVMIKFNDEEPVVLSSLTDNVIKSNIELKAGQDVTYELRAWLKEGTPNAEIGKHYHGKLTTNGNAIYTEYVEPNAPVLAEGMIPITYDNDTSTWVKADINNTDNNWYNYKNKMWANAVMVDNNILYDKSGNDNNSLIKGLTYNIDGLVFDGNDDYVQIPTDLGVTLPATYTVRFKTTSTSNQVIFGDYTTKAALGLYNSNKSLIVVLGNEATNIFDTGGLSLNTFYTITLVYNSLTDVTAYLNGVKLTKSSSTNNWSWNDTNSYIGKRSSGTYFAGTISNFIVHDKAVTASEATNLANNQVSSDSLKLNYDFTTDTRNQFMNSLPGVIVPEDVILAYYVWIPRYKYKLFNASYASGTSAQVIDVTFENGTSTTGTVTCTYASNGKETCQNKSNGKWYTHPAFTLGSTEVTGIWVGKFETTGTSTNPTIKPGLESLRSITVANMYNTGKLFRSTDYITSNGINQSDSHMMKNIEWGAVAYLKQSIYGLGITDIGVNSNSSYYTGGGTGTSYKTNIGQSTSGNITGVYDMSGGAWEYVMGNYNKTTGSSGLTVSGVPAEHIDIYSGTSVSASHLGDATGETAGWYSDNANFVYSSNPWFLRGGDYYSGDDAGVFYFYYNDGDADTSSGFRLVLSTTGA